MGDQPLMSNQPASTKDRLIEEIKAGGGKQALGLDQLDWGEKGGKLWECWKLEPCCGSPCNPKDGCFCCIHFTCCAICTNSRLLATTVNQPWACWPHCISYWCCQICTHSCLRYNLRRSAGVPGNICGDCICLCCCGACARCQELRSMPASMWTWIPDQMKAPEPSVPEMKFIA